DHRRRDEADDEPGRAVAHGLSQARVAHFAVAKKATAAAVITAVAVQPSALSHGPLVRSPMMARLLLTSMTSSRSGGARRPVTTAERKSMRIGGIPPRSRSMPATIEPANTR